MILVTPATLAAMMAERPTVPARQGCPRRRVVHRVEDCPGGLDSASERTGDLQRYAPRDLDQAALASQHDGHARRCPSPRRIRPGHPGRRGLDGPPARPVASRSYRSTLRCFRREGGSTVARCDR